MPSEEYNGRRTEIYFPSEDFLKKWKEKAKASGVSLSTWIFETVEASIDATSAPPSEQFIDQDILREQNRKLRRELESANIELDRLKTELFKLQHIHSNEYNEKMIEALQSGGVWPSQDLLKEAGISPLDLEAIQIISQQLYMLQDLGLVKESVKGWRWIGEP